MPSTKSTVKRKLPVEDDIEDIEGSQPQASRIKRKRVSNSVPISHGNDVPLTAKTRRQSRIPANGESVQGSQSRVRSRRSGQSTNAETATREEGKPSQKDVGLRRRRRSSGPAASKASQPSTQETQVGPRESSSMRSRQATKAPDTQYQHLASVSRHIPRHVIDSKWEPLPMKALDHVERILSSGESYVVMRLRDEQKRMHSSSALRMVFQRIRNKIGKGLPFPPSMRVQREEDFDYEKIFDSSRALAGQVKPLLDSLLLLKEKIGDELSLLELERTALADLERNAKDDGVKQRSKSGHSILDEFTTSEGATIDINLADHRDRLSLLDTIGTDDEVDPVTHELHNHLESITGNLKQVDGVRAAMDRSVSAVRDILMKHLDSPRFEHVLLG